MTETTSPPSLTREQAVALAEWMGRKRMDAAAIGEPYYIIVPDWSDGGPENLPGDAVDVYFSGQVERWCPLANANDDAQVLQRAREVGGPDVLVRVDAWLTAEARHRWLADPNGPGALSLSVMCLLYLQTGDYTRAVLSIICPTPV